MRRLLAKALIIGCSLLLLAGCSSLRLGYNSGPTLAWWWLDGYADFSREQSPPAKDAIARWFDWHRATQLPEYATLLAAAQAEIQAPTTAEAACAWQARVRTQFDPALDRALQEAAELIPLLGPAQWRHIAQRQAKARDEMKRDFLQPDPAERQQRSVRRAVERMERLYGRLDGAQRALVAQAVADSPFDAEAWAAERERRQRDTLQLMQRLNSEGADRDTRLAALRTLAERSERSPVPAYRAYQQQLADYNCAFAARVHNATTPAQRERARATLKGWEDDLRSLAARAGGDG